MKHIMLLSGIFLFAVVPINAQGSFNYDRQWKAIDKLIDGVLPQSALPEIQKVREAALKDKEWGQFVKAIVKRSACMQFTEENPQAAIVRSLMNDAEVLPFPARAVIQSLTAEALLNYYNQNRWNLYGRTPVADNKSTSDQPSGSLVPSVSSVPDTPIETWDAPQLIRTIILYYIQSLAEPVLLQRIPVDEVAEALEGDVATRYLRPTLYDLLAHRAIDACTNHNLWITDFSQSAVLDDPACFGDAQAFVNIPATAADSLAPTYLVLTLFRDLTAFRLAQKDADALADVNLKRFDYFRKRGNFVDANALHIAALEHLVTGCVGQKIWGRAAYALAMQYRDEGRRWEGDKTLPTRFRLADAARLCREIERKAPLKDDRKHAADLLAEITTGAINISVERTILPGCHAPALITSKNLSTAYIIIYKCPAEKLEQFYNRSGELKNIAPAFLAGLQDVATQTLALPVQADHQNHSFETAIPPLPIGNYLLALSNKPNPAKERSAILTFHEVQATGIKLLQRYAGNGAEELYALDALSGKPLQNAKIEAIRQVYSSSKKAYESVVADTLVTDTSGVAISRHMKEPYHRIRVTTGNDTLVETRRGYHTDTKLGAYIRTAFFTDRAIYRPAQAIHFKGIIYETDDDSHYAILPNTKTVVALYDVNHKEIIREEFTSNDFGSFNGTFTLPQNVLTGQMFIKNESDAAYFRMEEYKRPTFEVKMDATAGSHVLGDSITLAGVATALAGYPVDGAKVAYTVMRHRQYHPFARIFPSNAVATRHIANGTLTTKTDGRFTISFPAFADDIKPDDRSIYRYQLAVDVTDINGETQSATHEVPLSRCPLLISLTQPPPSNENGGRASVRFYSGGDTDHPIVFGEGARVKLETTNLSGTSVAADVELDIWQLASPRRFLCDRLWERPDTAVMTRDEHIALFPNAPFMDDDDPAAFAKAAHLATLKASTPHDKLIDIAALNAAPSGWYSLKITAKDATGSAVTDSFYIQLRQPEAPILRESEWITAVKIAGEPGDSAIFQIAGGFLPTQPVVQSSHDVSQLPNTDITSVKDSIHSVSDGIHTFLDTPRISLEPFRIHQDSIQTIQDSIYTSRDGVREFQDGIQTIQDDIRTAQDSIRLDEDGIHSPDSDTLSVSAHSHKSSRDVQVLTPSSDGSIIRIDILCKDKIIERRFIRATRIPKQLSIPIKEEYRGGFAVAFAMVEGNREYITMHEVHVPYTNKELDVAFTTFRPQLLPGEKERWMLTVKNNSGQPEVAEMVAALYDASLDAFAPHSWAHDFFHPRQHHRFSWQPDYEPLSGSRYIATLGQLYSGDYTMNYEHILLSREEEMQMLKNVRTMSRKSAAGREQIYGSSAMPEEEYGVILQETAVAGPQFDMADKVAGSDAEVLAVAGAPLTSIPLRANFSETAFFYPALRTDAKGEITIEFTIPEALTRWNMLGFAHTKDFKTGSAANSLITQKQVAVSANLPRFFREGDTLVLAAKVNNLTGGSIAGNAVLHLFDAYTMQPVDARILKTAAMQPFSVSAEGSASVQWTLAIPDGLQAVTMHLTAQAGNHTDGEERSIPVLSNRTLVTETMPFMLRGGERRDFRFARMAEHTSPTLRNHRLTLEYTSNPAWYAVQALPYLIEYPHECAEQVFSRLYANSLAATVANSNPRIKQVFNRWRDDAGGKALLSNLDKNTELKQCLLEETPWLMAAADESERKRRVGLLFDLNTMANGQQQAIAKLKAMQNDDGGFPWFAGMQSDRFITQHIVAGMEHLRRLRALPVNADITDVIEKAMHYCDARIAEDYRNEREHGKPRINNRPPVRIGSTAIHYLYACSFSQYRPGDGNAFDFYMKQAETEWPYISIYNQAMTALVMHRFGKPDVAQNILRSLKERAQQSDELGMYWANNRGGYFWNEAPIETQAMLIEAFAEAGDDTRAVAEMKIWLLRHKQASDWRTTKATAAAIYALLSDDDDPLLIEKAEPLDVRIAGKPLKKIAKEPLRLEAGTGQASTQWSDSDIKPAFADLRVTNPNAGVAWGAMYWQYFEDMDRIASAEAGLQITRQLFVRQSAGSGWALESVAAARPRVGDVITVRLELRADRDFEYVHLKDMRAAGLEPTDALSGYRYRGGVAYYESIRDASTNFFISYLRKGTYVFEYNLRVANAGDFSTGIATFQCMYAPEFNAHSDGGRVKAGK